MPGQWNPNEESPNTSMKTLLGKQNFHSNHPSSNSLSYALVTLEIEVSYVTSSLPFPSSSDPLAPHPFVIQVSKDIRQEILEYDL